MVGSIEIQVKEMPACGMRTGFSLERAILGTQNKLSELKKEKDLIRGSCGSFWGVN